MSHYDEPKNCDRRHKAGALSILLICIVLLIILRSLVELRDAQDGLARRVGTLESYESLRQASAAEERIRASKKLAAAEPAAVTYAPRAAVAKKATRARRR